MKNWKSTLIGAALAAADVTLQLLQNGDMTDWKNWIRPVLIAALGYVVADAKSTVKMIAFILAGSFMLNSCAEFPIVGVMETKFGTVEMDSKGHVVITPKVDRIIVPLHEK